MTSTPERHVVVHRSESRRSLYRRSRRLLVALLAGRLPGPRPALERAARRFLRDRSRSYLARVVRDRGFALAVATTLAVSTTATPLPPVNLSDVAAGNGGFVVIGSSCGSGAGDVNGDGLEDLLVGSTVVFGKADGTAVNLADIEGGNGGFAIHIGLYNCHAVSCAADVNGDGLDDVVVGDPAVSCPYPGPPCAGTSYVVFGKANGAAVEPADIVGGIGGFVVNGQPFDYSGFTVSGAGDVNGDGLADVAVHTPAYGDDQSVYVVFGKADGTAVDLTDVAGGDGGFVITATAADVTFDLSQAGTIAGAGDVNGDGLGDVIWGVPRHGPMTNTGEAYVVFGKADGAAVGLAEVADGSGGFIINGVEPSDHLGGSVSGAGDVNGDGLADMIVGTGNYNGARESYVVFGKADTSPVELTQVLAGDGGGFVIHRDSPAPSDGISRVSGAGDVNGDGLADVIVGTPFADLGGENSNEGASYVVFGKADTTPVFLSDVVADVGGFALFGINPGDLVGTTVSDAGDVNGDGLADVIVGSFGLSYVVFSPFGPACPWDLDGDNDVWVPDLLLLLMDFGSCDGSPADFDGDGCVTVLDLLTLLSNFGPCSAGGCPWDVNGNGIVEVADVWQVLGQLGEACDGCPEDVDGNGVVNLSDSTEIIAHLGPCPGSGASDPDPNGGETCPEDEAPLP